MGIYWPTAVFILRTSIANYGTPTHRTQNTDKQLAFAVYIAVYIHQSLSRLSSSIMYGTTEYDLFIKLTGKRLPVNKDMIESDINIVGAVNSEKLLETEKTCSFQDRCEHQYGINIQTGLD